MQKTTLMLAFNKLEASRQAILKMMEAIDDKARQYKPAENKWSITQIFYHLNFSESRSMNYVKKKMLGGDNLKKTGMMATVRFTALKLFLHSGYKWKAPPVLGEVPEQLNYHEVIQQWNDTRKQLQLMIETIPDKMLDREIYRHPRAGRLNLLQMVEFFQDHFDHHRVQVKRLIKDSTGKKSEA